jgi:uncharacterized protein (TIGR02246 family)
MDVQQLIDENEIRDLTARFTAAVNRGDAKTLGDLFTEDGEWHVPGMPTTVGREAAAERIGGLRATFANLLQLLHSGQVEVDGDRATSEWYLSETASDADGNGFAFTGIYQDELVRTAGGWRFARRGFTFLYRGKAELRGKWYSHPEAPAQG